MRKKKKLTYSERMIRAIECLPKPLVDKRHRLLIHFIDNQVRSNETRYDHIILKRHELVPSDIKRISECINESILRKDKDRKDSYNIYIERNGFSGEYIKISLYIDYKISNNAYVKTIFITKNLK